MFQVENEARGGARIGESGTDHSRFAMVEASLGVEQVGDEGGAGVERGARLLGRGVGVTDGHGDTGCGQ